MKQKCEHEVLEIIRELKTGKQVTSCKGCQRVWKDRGKKFKDEFKTKEEK